jgi:transposase InsO family protein
MFRFHRWRANLRVLDVAEIKTVAHVPLSHPFVERLIGTIRREFLDLTPFWGADDLRGKLANFQTFYNEHRCHQSLGGDRPGRYPENSTPRRAHLGNYGWQSHRRSLFQTPMAA